MVGSSVERVYRMDNQGEEGKRGKPQCMRLGEVIEEGLPFKGVRNIGARRSMSDTWPDLYYTLRVGPNVPVETEMVEVHSQGCTGVDVEREERLVIGECPEDPSERCGNCVWDVAKFNDTAKYIIEVVGVRSYDDDEPCY